MGSCLTKNIVAQVGLTGNGARVQSPHLNSCKSSSGTTRSRHCISNSRGICRKSAPHGSCQSGRRVDRNHWHKSKCGPGAAWNRTAHLEGRPITNRITKQSQRWRGRKRSGREDAGGRRSRSRAPSSIRGGNGVCCGGVYGDGGGGSTGIPNVRNTPRGRQNTTSARTNDQFARNDGRRRHTSSRLCA